MCRIAKSENLALLQHHRLRIICDNTGTVSNFKTMNASSTQQLTDVRVVYELALRYDIELEFVWKPRSTPAVQHADRLSKIEDPHDFYLNDHVFQALCRAWGTPSVDAFASAGDGHKCPRYFALYEGPGCTEVDAYAQSWQQQFVYAFPGPLYDPSRIIRKIREDACDAMLVLPSFRAAYWQGTLRALPIRDSIDLSYWDGLYLPGPLVPDNLRASIPRVPLTAYLIKS